MIARVILTQDDYYIFCPICHECAPYHHGSVKHDMRSPEMSEYFKKLKDGKEIEYEVDWNSRKLNTEPFVTDSLFHKMWRKDEEKT